jgi:hypothetical protein
MSAVLTQFDQRRCGSQTSMTSTLDAGFSDNCSAGRSRRRLLIGAPSDLILRRLADAREGRCRLLDELAHQASGFIAAAPWNGMLHPHRDRLNANQLAITNIKPNAVDRHGWVTQLGLSELATWSRSKARLYY